MANIELTDEIRDYVNGALMSGNPMILASVDEAGRPRLSFRGSTQAISGDQLGFWVRNAGGASLKAIEGNPHVALMYRDGARRVFLQFNGRARVAEGVDRERIYDGAPESERNADPQRKGVAVIVDLDQVEGILGLDQQGQRRPVSLRRA